MTDAPHIHTITGPTILLGSGSYFDFLAPDFSDITIEDVAHGLAFQSRFAGQCVSRRTGRRVYYSVAQHCVIMAHHAPSPHKLAALMHDAAEAVMGDMVAPLKSICRDFRSLEKLAEAALAETFGTATPCATIRHLDMRMLATERRDLMAQWRGEVWPGAAEPFEAEIVPIEDPHAAAQVFLACWHALTEDRS